MPYQTLQDRVIHLDPDRIDVEQCTPGTLFFEGKHLSLVCPCCGRARHLPEDLWQLSGSAERPTLRPDVQCSRSCGAALLITELSR